MSDEIELRPPNQFDRRELERLRKMAEVVPEGAVTIGLIYCNHYKVIPPAWLLSASARLASRQLHPDTRHKRGRANSPLARLRQDKIHYVRWDTITEFRDNQKRTKSDYRELVRRKKAANCLTRADASWDAREQMLLEHYTDLHRWLGTTWLRLYECVSIFLQDTPAAGSPEAMKASYLRVHKHLKDRRQAARYYLPEPALCRALGLAEFEDELWVKNHVSFFYLKG